MRNSEKFYACHNTMTAFFLEIIAKTANIANKFRHQIAAKELSAGSETEHLTHKIKFYAVNIIAFEGLFYRRVHLVTNDFLLVIKRSCEISVGNVMMNSVCFGVFSPKSRQHRCVVFGYAVNVVHSKRKPRTDTYFTKMFYPGAENIEIIANERFVIRVIRVFANISVFVNGLSVFVKFKTAGCITVNDF